LNEWQIAEIKAAIKEAEAGEFATEEEVAAIFRKWRSLEVRCVRRALANLDELAAYIARDDFEGAARKVELIRANVDQLAFFPALGRTGRVTGTRELVIAGTSYVVPYRIRQDRIEVLRVIHSARQWPRKL
jgi:addiction module RelE/StbE family toxin